MGQVQDPTLSALVVLFVSLVVILRAGRIVCFHSDCLRYLVCNARFLVVPEKSVTIEFHAHHHLAIARTLRDAVTVAVTVTCGGGGRKQIYLVA